MGVPAKGDTAEVDSCAGYAKASDLVVTGPYASKKKLQLSLLSKTGEDELDACGQ